MHGWIYGYFWTSATIIYLILRQDVDGTPWHAIVPPEPRAFDRDLEATQKPPGDTGELATPEPPLPASAVTSEAPSAS